MSELTAPPVHPAPPEQQQSGIFQPFRTSRSFTALWGGQTTAALGNSIFFVMLPIIVYQISHSTLAMGLVMALLSLPQVVMLPFAGLLVDKLPRVALMMATDGMRFALLAGITWLSASGHLTMHWLYGFAIVYGAMNGLFLPAYSAVRAQVFTPEIRNAANSLTQISNQGSQLIGPSLGGIIISVTSAALGLLINALTFIVSIVSLVFVKTSRLSNTDTPAHEIPSFWYELFGGVRELKKHAWLWVTIVAFMFVNVFSGGIIGVLLPWLMKVHLHDPAYDFGLVTSASAIGAMLAAMFMGSRSQWRHRGYIAYGGVALAGLGLLFTPLTSSVPLIMVLSAFVGAGLMAFGVIWEGSLQDLVPPEAFGRVASIDMFGSFALMPLGYLVTGWLAQAVGGKPTFVGEALLILFIALGTLMVPAIRRFD